MHVTKRVRFFEVGIENTAVNNHSFKSDSQLEAAHQITAIQAFRVAEVTNGPNSQKALLSDAVFNNSFLVLLSNDGSTELVTIPLSDLNRKDNNGLMFICDLPAVSFTNCYIKVATTAGLDTAKIWLLAFHYKRKHDA